MAGADYKHCSVCGAKAFYDASIKNSYPFANGDPEKFEYWYAEGLVTLCPECFETHKIYVLPKCPDLYSRVPEVGERESEYCSSPHLHRPQQL